MDRKVLYVNSSEQYRDAGGTDADFTITKTIREFSLVPKSVKLSSATIPFTWSNLVAGSNDTFSIFEDGTGTDNFVIPAGTYDGDTLATQVQTLINASGVLAQTYTVTYDSALNSFTFTTAPSGMQIIFAPTGSAAVLLGFAEGTTNPGAPSTSVTSSGAAQLVPDHEIFICTDLVQGSDNGVIPWGVGFPGLTQNQVIARVPLTACRSGFIHYSASPDLPFFTCIQSKFSKIRNSTDSTSPSIRFYLQFPSGIAVDLQGFHWSCELILDFNQ